MTKFRYDKDKDLSRHAAASPRRCQWMETKYGWVLVDVEQVPDSPLPVDCVFKGYTEFPESFYENESEEND